jgi:hypothetical protein
MNTFKVSVYCHGTEEVQHSEIEARTSQEAVSVATDSSLCPDIRKVECTKLELSIKTFNIQVQSLDLHNIDIFIINHLTVTAIDMQAAIKDLKVRKFLNHDNDRVISCEEVQLNS